MRTTGSDAMTGEGRNLGVEETFRLQDDSLRWSIRVRNNGKVNLEIGDLAIPLPMNTVYSWNKEETFTKAFYRHQFISGNGSFVFWQPVRGCGDCLVMLPNSPTKLEYFSERSSNYALGGDEFTAYIHSAAAGDAKEGSWRQPHSSRTLTPGESAEYGFSFHWAKDLAGVREVLYRHGGFDVAVVPGMVLPEDLTAKIASACLKSTRRPGMRRPSGS